MYVLKQSDFVFIHFLCMTGLGSRTDSTFPKPSTSRWWLQWLDGLDKLFQDMWRWLKIPGSEVIKKFHAQISWAWKFFLLINVKIPTSVGILTFMSRKNNIIGTSEHEKGRISWYSYEHLKFHAKKSFITWALGTLALKKTPLVYETLICKTLPF